MSFPLNTNPDGAKPQARAILAMTSDLFGDGIEESYDTEHEEYLAEPIVARWDNGRERGYMIRMRDSARQKQINIGFWEGRSGDQIEVMVFESAPTTNSPTLAETPSEDEWDAAIRTFDYGKVTEAARYVMDTLSAFWVTNAKPENMPEAEADEDIPTPEARRALVESMLQEVDPFLCFYDVRDQGAVVMKLGLDTEVSFGFGPGAHIRVASLSPVGEQVIEYDGVSIIEALAMATLALSKKNIL
jgi:hypothetical protein